MAARGGTLLSRGQKWVKRHRVAAFAAAIFAFGLASGAVKISPWAAFAITFMGVCFYMSFRLTGMEYGKEIARSQYFARVLFLSASLLFAYIEIKAFSDTKSVMLVNFSVLSVFYLFMLGRWPFRGRWAGAILLNLSRPRHKAAFVWATTMGVSMVFFVIATIMEPKARDSGRIIYIFGMSIFAVYMFSVWGKLEFRERGIVQMGSLVSWRRLQSYRWEEPSNDFAVLSVRYKRLIPLPLPDWKLYIPIQHRADAEAFLKRQLGAWPEGTAAA